MSTTKADDTLLFFFFSMPIIGLLFWLVQKVLVVSYAITIKFTPIWFYIFRIIKVIRMNGYFLWTAEKQPPEVFYKKSEKFLKISQSSQESTCPMVYFE